MIRKTMLAFLLLAFSVAASAEAPKAKGAYIGASAGVSLFDDDGALGVFIDDEDKAFQGYVGYKFFEHFGVEARVTDFGSFSDGFESLDISSYSIHAVGFIPFGESGWELFGQIGFAQINQEVSGFVDTDDTAVTGGVGVRWHINQNVALAGQVDAYVWQNDLIGSAFDLSVGANMLSIQANF